MTLYDKLKDKEIIKELQQDVIDALKDKEWLVQLTWYQVCKIHWMLHPTSNDMNIGEIQNLFED